MKRELKVLSFSDVEIDNRTYFETELVYCDEVNGSTVRFAITEDDILGGKRVVLRPQTVCVTREDKVRYSLKLTKKDLQEIDLNMLENAYEWYNEEILKVYNILHDNGFDDYEFYIEEFVEVMEQKLGWRYWLKQERGSIVADFYYYTNK